MKNLTTSIYGNIQFLLFCIIASSPFSLNAVSCDATRTFNCGPSELCLGEEAEICLFECVDWQNVTYEWTVEKCPWDPVTNTVDCNNPIVVTPTPIVTTGPWLNYPVTETGILQFKVNVRDNATGQIIASPCISGTPTCLEARIEVFGTKIPEFDIVETSCSYNPVTKEFARTIEITPTVNNDQSAFLGVFVTVDWGDGQSQHRNVSVTGSNNATFSHTYTWSKATNPNPSFPIAVTARTNNLFPATDYCNTLEQFTLDYNPECYEVNMVIDVIESNCYQETVCFPFWSDFVAARIYDEHGTLIDQIDPGPSQCVTLYASGDYTVLYYDNFNICPQIFYFSVRLSPPTAGNLSTSNTSIDPNGTLEFQLSNPNNEYVVYELFVNGCMGGLDWLVTDFGPANQMNSYSVPDYVMNILTPCMLNEDFEFCFRARVLCSPDDLIYENAGTVSNTICLPICVDGGEPGGCGGDPSTCRPGYENDNNTEQSSIEGTIASPDQALNKVYPNPSRGLVQVDLDARENGYIATLQVVNTYGQVVWEEEVDERVPNSLSMDLSAQSAGVYFLRLRSEQANTTLSSIVLHR